MRIKATWFIPGLLLTLLLGLLWALPTSAATGVVSATSDDKGKNAIDYIMPGAMMYIQVADSDLNTITKHGEGTVARMTVTAGETLSLGTIVDRNQDGQISKSDFTFYESADKVAHPDPIATAPNVTVSQGNETVSFDGTAYVSFHQHTPQTLGGRESQGTKITNLVDGNTASTLSLNNMISGLDLRTAPAPVLADILPVRTGTHYNTSVKVFNVNGAGENKDVEFQVQVAVDNDDTLPGGGTGADGIPDDQVITDGAVTTPGGPIDVTGLNIGDPDVVDGSPADLPLGMRVDYDDSNSDGSMTDLVTTDVRFEFTFRQECIGDCNSAETDALSTVTVSNNAAGNGTLDVVLMETGANTGIFSAMIQTTPCGDNGCDGPSQGRSADEINPALDNSGTGLITVPLAADGSVDVMYKDASPRGNRRLSIPADSTGPSFDNYMPANGTTGQGDRHSYSVEVSDGQSGIAADDRDAKDDNNVVFMVWAADGDNDHVKARARQEYKEEAIDGGYRITDMIGSSELDMTRGDTYDIHFWVVARDVAGNWMATDTKPTLMGDDPSTTDRTEGADHVYDNKCMVPSEVMGVSLTTGGTFVEVDIDVEALAANGCDPHIVSVDNTDPTLANAEAGAHLNSQGKHDTGKRTSVGVEFSENLDCSTVAASDFEVDGATPSAADCKGAWVYLTVDELAPDAEPKVELVGSVDDAAGNSQNEGDAIAVDKNKAAISVTVAGTYDSGRAVTKDKITISATSDETLTQAPMATIYRVGAGRVLTDSVISGALSSKGTNQWSREFTIDDAGLYVVTVTGTDRGSGLDTTVGVGKKDDKIDLKSESAMFFEVDNVEPSPTFTPEDDSSTDNPNLFIRLDYSSEGMEYPIKDGEKTLDQDTHGTVWLTKATFDGGNYDNADVLDMISTRDNVKFLFSPGDLAIDEYRLTVEAKDNAGNTATSTLDFNVTARQAYTIGLNAGANLISFPAALEDGAVDAVFADPAVTQVLTYDNAMGLWMTATRGDDGMFAGDLMMVDNHHAYWVIADTPADVSAMLPRGGAFSTFPPAIEVYQGWNLVPIANVDQMAAGTAMLAQDYFANIDWEVAYGYSEGQYQRIEKGPATLTLEDAEPGHQVMTGMGYFVYVNEAGVIIP